MYIFRGEFPELLSDFLMGRGTKRIKEVTNRFKGLDLIRVPEELWMEVHDTVQEAGIKTIPLEKKCKKTKWLSEEACE